MKIYSGLLLVGLFLFQWCTTVAQNLDLSPGHKLILQSALFDVNSDSLDAKMIEKLDEIGTYLQTRPDLKIEISGHSDATGTASANEQLSLRRATRAKEYLISHYSLSKDNLIAKGFGSSRSLNDNSTPEYRAKNRRIEFTPLSAISKRELTDVSNNPTNEEGLLTFFDGSVQTKAPWQVGFSDALLKEPIYELHKINTRRQSLAEITFIDRSKLKVSENSLVVVYGFMAGEQFEKTKGNIELTRGGLLTKLRSMDKGKKYLVNTPAAIMKFPSTAEGKIGVDSSDRSTVSIYLGESEVTASGKSIVVPENFGTQIIKDSPPETPRKLPNAPVIVSPDKEIAPWKPDGVDFAWKAQSPKVKLEISRDTSFNSLAWSSISGETNRKIPLEPGTYYWHMQGIDDIGLEGKPTQIGTLVVKKYDYDKAMVELVTVKEGKNTTDSPEFDLAGFVDPKSTVSINNYRLEPGVNGKFVQHLFLQEGNNSYLIAVRDSNGFENWKSVIIEYVPSIPLTVAFAFSPAAIPTYYSSLGAGASLTLRLPNLIRRKENIGINIGIGEFSVSPPDGDGTTQPGGSETRGYGIAEMSFTFESKSESNSISFLEITGGTILWPKFNGNLYRTQAGAAVTAGIGAGVRSGEFFKSFGMFGSYRMIFSDAKRFDPLTQHKLHGLLEFQVLYYF